MAHIKSTLTAEEANMIKASVSRTDNAIVSTAHNTGEVAGILCDLEDEILHLSDALEQERKDRKKADKINLFVVVATLILTAIGVVVQLIQ